MIRAVSLEIERATYEIAGGSYFTLPDISMSYFDVFLYWHATRGILLSESTAKYAAALNGIAS